jgi:hypothetical protein
MSDSEETQTRQNRNPKTPEGNDRADFAKLAEFQRGNLDVENDYLPEFAGKVPDEHAQILNMMVCAYAETEGQKGVEKFKDSALYQRLMMSGMTEQVQKAVRNGNMEAVQNIIGEPQTDHDLSGIELTRELRKDIRKPAYTCYIHGQMGHGKTDFALLLAELWLDEMKARGMKPELGSNIMSVEKAEGIETWDKFMSWLENPSKKERRLFIFDEASKHASGYSGDAQNAREQLGKTINLIRKYQGSIIMIGHTGKDVHKDIRRKCIHFVRKPDKKTALVRTREDVGKGKGEQDTKFEFSNVPQTSISYDTMEASGWDWGSNNQAEQAYRLHVTHDIPIDSKKTYSLTDHYDVSHTTIHRWFNDMSEERKAELEP